MTNEEKIKAIKDILWVFYNKDLSNGIYEENQRNVQLLFDIDKILNDNI